MIYGSVCSGIEAATAAWHPLGWRPAFFAEIEKAPCAVLAHHYPDVPNHGDMTKFKEWPDAAIDVLVGGTPCQSFSVAGLRKGLDDPRGNLTLTYLAVAAKYRPKWLVWENVPGVLSDATGAFGAFLGGLGQLGYGFAYRILDAQHFGVPQRRRRVFVVGCAGDWRPAAAVLFESHSLSGHPAPRREAGQGTANSLESGATGGSEPGLSPALAVKGANGPRQSQKATTVVDVAPTLNAHFGSGQGLENQHIDGEGGCLLPNVSFCLNAGGMGRLDSETETMIPVRGGSLDTLAIDLQQVTSVVAFQTEQTPRASEGLAFTLTKGSPTGGGQPQCVAFGTQMSTPHWQHDLSDTLQAKNPKGVAFGMRVRRLTPRECERLQGLPDDYTLVPYRGKPMADGPRHKALGNSMTVPVMAWIGQRIAMVEEIKEAA